MSAPLSGCVALIAAAGRSRRMGRWKGALPWHGGATLLEAHVAALRTLAAAGIWCAIPGARAEDGFPGGAPRPLVVEIDSPDAPLFATVRLLIAAARSALGSALRIAIVTPVDAPPVSAEVLDALATAAVVALDSAGARVIRPVHCDPSENRPRSGHPILLTRSALDDLLALDPATGRLDGYVRSLPQEQRVEVPVADPRIVADMNTPEEYDRLRAATSA